MTNTHWADRSRAWGQSGPPLQPNQEIIDCFASLIPLSANILLMGVTPQIANAYTHVTAVDREPAMIENVWPGDTETKRAIQDNWLTVALPENHYDGIIGDGSINMLSYPEDVSFMLGKALTLLKPGGVFACRMFTRPDKPVTMERLLAEAKTPTVNFSAYRRLIPMYLAAKHGPLVPVRLILELFDQMFPDRSQLPWTADQMSTLDAYRNSESTTWFPTRDEILALAPPGSRYIESGTYDIADTCPILTFAK
jgi:SAM-dependent methyltransferase